MIRARRGMALAVTIGVVSLIAILAVATLSLAARLLQESTLGLRDARLDAAAALGLASATDEWRSRSIGRLAAGASVAYATPVAGVPVSVTVSITRISADLFWVAAEAVADGGATRRENLILRRRIPDAQSLIAEDTTNVVSLGFLAIDSIAASADLHLPAGAVLLAPTGVVHVAGNATLSGGSGQGILIVDGVLAITGPVTFAGVVVARAGISVAAGGVGITGLVRAAGSPPVAGALGLTRDAITIQDVLCQSLTPVAVRGRRWQELH